MPALFGLAAPEEGPPPPTPGEIRRDLHARLLHDFLPSLTTGALRSQETVRAEFQQILDDQFQFVSKRHSWPQVVDVWYNDAFNDARYESARQAMEARGGVVDPARRAGHAPRAQLGLDGHVLARHGVVPEKRTGAGQGGAQRCASEKARACQADDGVRPGRKRGDNPRHRGPRGTGRSQRKRRWLVGGKHRPKKRVPARQKFAVAAGRPHLEPE